LFKNKSQTAKLISVVWQPLFKVVSQTVLSCLDNFSAFDTTSANFHSHISALRTLNADPLQIRIKPTARFVVSM
jgi:hypothetical protein